jgi:hypothetical protein
MWFKEYRDYPIDSGLKKQQVSPGKGIIGCEMHDLNGWGNSYHEHSVEKKHGVFMTFFISLFSRHSPKDKNN